MIVPDIDSKQKYRKKIVILTYSFYDAATVVWILVWCRGRPAVPCGVELSKNNAQHNIFRKIKLVFDLIYPTGGWTTYIYIDITNDDDG